MKMKINNPYVFSKVEIDIIKQNFKTHVDWEKGAFDQIKKNITDHLRQEQNNKCCYCRIELGFDIKAVDIEHIVPKSKFEKYTFHPSNLALSCPGCNTSKGKQNVTLKDIKQYPRSGRNISIIHAHFDPYSDHIEIHEDAVYEGLSVKGCETIKVCKIFRLKDVLRKKREREAQATPIQSLVEALRMSTPTQQENLAHELIRLIQSHQ